MGRSIDVSIPLHVPLIQRGRDREEGTDILTTRAKGHLCMKKLNQMEGNLLQDSLEKMIKLARSAISHAC